MYVIMPTVVVSDQYCHDLGSKQSGGRLTERNVQDGYAYSTSVLV